MTDEPTPHELSERIARLEERMKTMQAEYTTALERIAGDQKAVLERTSGDHKTAIEKLSKELVSCPANKFA